MTSLETYQTRINELKASIENLKSCGPLIIHNLPGRAALAVGDSEDLYLPVGTVIAGNGYHVFLRVPHGSIYWASSDRDGRGPDGYGLEEFFAYLRRHTERGEQFRIVHQPSGNRGAHG